MGDAFDAEFLAGTRDGSLALVNLQQGILPELLLAPFALQPFQESSHVGNHRHDTAVTNLACL